MNRPARLMQRITRWSAVLVFTSIAAIVVATSLLTGAVLEVDTQSTVDSRIRTRIERASDRLATGKDVSKLLSLDSPALKVVQIALFKADGSVQASSVSLEQLESLKGFLATSAPEIRLETGELTSNGIAVAVRVGTQRLADGSILLAYAAAPRNANAGGEVLRQAGLLIALSLVGASCVYLLLRFTALRPLDRAVKREQRLIADASHEMRTTAAVISAGVELLADRKAVAPAQEQLLKDLQSESRRLNRMVGNLLKQSSIPRESTSAHLHPAELDSIINQAIRRITLIAPPGVRVEASLHALQNTQLSAPQSILESALDALLENAVQHAASRVLIGCEMAGRTVCLLVDDDGPGIAPVHRDAVMAPFARAESGRGSQGSGLGLAIASAAVKQLEGSLVIEDSPLGGARLRLEFEPERPVKSVIS